MKEEVSVTLITKASDLPGIICDDFFQSVELFKILEATPKQKPYMALATDGQGLIVAHLLAVVSYHHLLLPRLPIRIATYMARAFMRLK